MVDEVERSRSARATAEAALVRVIHHYGGLPEIVVLGGLVMVDHPDYDERTMRADAVLAVTAFSSPALQRVRASGADPSGFGVGAAVATRIIGRRRRASRDHEEVRRW